MMITVLSVNKMKNTFLILAVIFACSDINSMSAPTKFAEIENNTNVSIVGDTAQKACDFFNLRCQFGQVCSEEYKNNYITPCLDAIKKFQNNKINGPTLVGYINQLIRAFNNDVDKSNKKLNEPNTQVTTSYTA